MWEFPELQKIREIFTSRFVRNLLLVLLNYSTVAVSPKENNRDVAAAARDAFQSAAHAAAAARAVVELSRSDSQYSDGR
ncbi:hypothetical protein LWI29_016073 [Acer saccharum]|uniref:Uncharacterized protein n=1 Tax=Acer saccharum TaxID=4024 RepID=A0AA39VLS5_ACESA|nr:hypothetical protein LWI29_016073 [Acer saccharum]